MKSILIGLIFILTASFGYSQDVTSDLDTVNPEVDSIFIKFPELYVHGLRGNFADTKVMYETYELNKRVWDFQAKQVKGMAIGGGVMALGAAGWWYTLGYLNPPVYQTSNVAGNQNADDAKRKQQIAGWTSTAVFAVGATIFAVSFKNHKRIRAEVGLNTMRLEYRLFGNRPYFNGGDAPRELKNRGLYPTRTRKLNKE